MSEVPPTGDTSIVTGGDRTKLAFSNASDSVKQVLTLSATILAFTVTFSTTITKGASNSDLLWLRLSWLLFAISILAGVLTMLCITGRFGRPGLELDVYAWNISLFAALQMLAFVIAVAFATLFGALALSSSTDASTSGKCTIEAPATGSCEISPN